MRLGLGALLLGEDLKDFICCYLMVSSCGTRYAVIDHIITLLVYTYSSS